MEVKYSKAALKFLAKSDKATVNRIGKYRIIFKWLLDGTYEIIYIMDIGSRGDIYK